MVIARLKRRRDSSLVVLLVLIVTALGLDAWQRSSRQGGDRMWLDNVVCASALPFQGALTAGLHWGETQWQVFFRARELKRENARLAAEVSELRSRLVEMEENYREATGERNLRGKYPDLSRRGRAARVVSAGRGGWLSYLVVDAGSKNGVKVKDVALAVEGVVGQVYAVSGDSARVLPITDRTSRVAALAKDSRETGILMGAGGDGCELRFLAPDAQVKPGELVLTSGKGGIFPKGLLLGAVVSIEPEPLGIGKRAIVRPAVRFHKLEQVLLIRAPAVGN